MDSNVGLLVLLFIVVVGVCIGIFAMDTLKVNIGGTVA